MLKGYPSKAATITMWAVQYLSRGRRSSGFQQGNRLNINKGVYIMSTQTVHFGTNTTEFPLAGAPAVSNGITSFALTPSASVTAEAVLAAVKDADGYTITTDGTAGETQDNFALSGNVAIDAGTGNIVFSMRRKSVQTITNENLQAQVDALGQQVVALTLGGGQ